MPWPLFFNAKWILCPYEFFWNYKHDACLWYSINSNQLNSALLSVELAVMKTKRWSSAGNGANDSLNMHLLVACFLLFSLNVTIIYVKQKDLHFPRVTQPSLAQAIRHLKAVHSIRFSAACTNDISHDVERLLQLRECKTQPGCEHVNHTREKGAMQSEPRIISRWHFPCNDFIVLLALLWGGLLPLLPLLLADWGRGEKVHAHVE